MANPGLSPWCENGHIGGSRSPFHLLLLTGFLPATPAWNGLTRNGNHGVVAVAPARRLPPFLRCVSKLEPIDNGGSPPDKVELRVIEGRKATGPEVIWDSRVAEGGWAGWGSFQSNTKEDSHVKGQPAKTRLC